jgi:signal transduction histidine kinase
MLDMAKVEAGQNQLDIELIDCTQALEDALRMIRPRAEAGGVTLGVTLDLHAQPVAALFADRRAFKQILLNVVGNAVKFTPAGGRVTVRVRTTASNVELQVIDTGIGIAETDLANIGKPFFRAKHQLSAGAEGTGLGLALTISLVKLHGWEFGVVSKPGRGTTVTITIHNAALTEIISEVSVAAG